MTNNKTYAIINISNERKEDSDMKMNEIMDTIKMLAQSQGFYGRLLRSLEEAYEENYDAFMEFMNELEEQNFKDTVDLVLYLEC